MSINALLNFKPKTPIIDLTPFQRKLLKNGGLCLLVVPFSIVALLGLYAMYEAAIQILWGILNFGQFRTYNMAKLVAQVGFVVTIIYVVALYVHHREQAKKVVPAKKQALNEAA